MVPIPTSLLHQEVDEGRSGGEKGFLDASPLQVSGAQLALKNKLTHSVLVPGHLLGHRDFATGFVVDLRRQARDKEY